MFLPSNHLAALMLLGSWLLPELDVFLKDKRAISGEAACTAEGLPDEYLDTLVADLLQQCQRFTSGWFDQVNPDEDYAALLLGPDQHVGSLRLAVRSRTEGCRYPAKPLPGLCRGHYRLPDGAAATVHGSTAALRQRRAPAFEHLTCKTPHGLRKGVAEKPAGRPVGAADQSVFRPYDCRDGNPLQVLL